MAKPTLKKLDMPDEVVSLPGGVRLELVEIGGLKIGRGTAPPGWRWSEHAHEFGSSELCEMTHVGVIVSGREAVRMRDGTEVELRPGDVFEIGPGHDAWVVGDEPCVSLDFLPGD